MHSCRISACSSLRCPEREILGSNSLSASATQRGSPPSTSATCLASPSASTSSSRSPAAAAYSSATSSPSPRGRREGCCNTATHAAARRRCAASQCTGSAAEASSRRKARETRRIAGDVEAGRSAWEPTPMRVSELAGSSAGTRPAAARASRKSMCPSTSEVSSSRCCPARLPPSPCGWPEPGAGMPSLVSTSGVIRAPRPSSCRIRSHARCEKPAASKSALEYCALASAEAIDADG
mmetsp:Transcript_33014/g.77151  ORF Transcript_33014/g.77151 Transcript_33014/m.77151 type:complete len:237 (+) Transcript_33014:610-1320(+)